MFAFGAAGEMISCPAEITVMFLATATGRAALGLLAVLCFSLAPLVSAVAVLSSGIAALLIAH